MQTTGLQLLITLLAVAAVYNGWYNQLSDPIEKDTGKPYAFSDFFAVTWANALYRVLAGFVLLLVLNEGGLELLKHYIEVPDFAEKIGDMTIAVISGLFGHKLINKFI